MSNLTAVRQQFSEFTPSQRYTTYMKYKTQFLESLKIELSELPFTLLEDTNNALSMQRPDNTYSILEFKEQL